MIDTIPEVTWGLVTCRECEGRGYFTYVGPQGYIEDYEMCEECYGQGEIVDVIEVRDGKEVIEYE